MATAIRVDRNVEVPMRDGTILRADVWRPDGPGPFPTLVRRTPYQKEVSASSDCLRVELAADAGYAVVIQDTRGKFASDGKVNGLSRATWQIEAADTYDTVEWAAAQPWSTGSVGMFGMSYGAALVFLGAMEQPPHLRAIAPAMMGDQAHDHLDFGGAFRLYTYYSANVGAALGSLPELLASGGATMDDAATLMAAVRDHTLLTDFLPLDECPYFELPGVPATAQEVLSGEHGAPDEFVVERVAVPALLVGGWFDLYPAQVVDQFQRLRAASAGGDGVRAEHRMIIGPWTHTQWLTGVAGEVNFGFDGGGQLHAHPAHMAFFDRHLRGSDVALPPVKYFLMGADEWRDADEWPPPGARTSAWFLHSDGDADRLAGRLSVTPPGDEPPDHYDYDPMNPVPSHGGRLFGPGVGGPLDQTHLGARPDVLIYTSDVLTEAVDVAGPVVVRLHASSSATDTDFVAKLIDVHPDGRELLVCSGLRRARYRNGFDAEQLLEPGRVEEIEINLTHTAMRFRPGHRLQLQICSSDFPHLDRNMNTGNALGTDAKGIVATQTVHHDGTHPSCVELSVMAS